MSLGPRSRVEHASAPWVERLQQVPVPVRVVLGAALVVLGLLVPRPWGGIAILVVAAYLAWLMFLTWQRLTLPERLLRAAVLALAAALTVVRLIPSS